MLFTLLMVLYVVLAIFMIGFILIQRGAGASAGSGFGAGASATVFGSRGASSFLTKSTKWLAIAFFLLTLGMAVYVQRTGLVGQRTTGDDIGIMSGVAAPAGDVPVVVDDRPQVPQTDAAGQAELTVIPEDAAQDEETAEPAEDAEQADPEVDPADDGEE